jgi:very-short-patch-repair endonuclease
MVGTDQALYIDSVLRRRLSVSEYQKREILCGNASQFQGDERDVIFLSMVNSPSDRPLTMRQREDAKKVFNVAASRARDQLWVVHSLDPRRDLKHGDLRLQLISHAENPEALRAVPEAKRKEFHSELEKQVLLELTRKNYRVIHRHEVGEYVIDLVVEGEGSRIAIQCDGDRMESVEAVMEALERQFTLERLGWEFVRLRGSEFFRDPDKVLGRLVRRLEECEIRPRDPDPEAEAAAEDSPVVKVIKRAEMIRTRWKDIPSVSSIRSQPVLAEADPG